MNVRAIFGRDKVITGLLGIGIGFVAGALTHALPEWLCGPFRFDKAAEWSAVLIGAVAAAVTLWAVRVAIVSSRTAILVERELRGAEVERAESARRRQASILAGSFIVDLRHVISVCTERSRMLHDSRMFGLKRNFAGVMRMSTPNLDTSGSRFDVFDLDEGIAFLRIATAVHRLRKGAENNMRLHENWNEDMVEYGRDALVKSLIRLRDMAIEALSMAAGLCGRGERTGRWVEAGESAYQRRIKNGIGGFLPGGARTRPRRRRANT